MLFIFQFHCNLSFDKQSMSRMSLHDLTVTVYAYNNIFLLVAQHVSALNDNFRCLISSLFIFETFCVTDSLGLTFYICMI